MGERKTPGEIAKEMGISDTFFKGFGKKFYTFGRIRLFLI